jgi:hypothetical protein
MYERDIEEIESDMLPFGYYNDGNTDIEDEEEEYKWSSGGENWFITSKKEFKMPWDKDRK